MVVDSGISRHRWQTRGVFVSRVLVCAEPNAEARERIESRLTERSSTGAIHTVHLQTAVFLHVTRALRQPSGTFDPYAVGYAMLSMCGL